MRRIRIVFNRRSLAAQIRKSVDFRTYIDEIQSTIAKTSWEIGIGHTKQERERGKRRLSHKLRELSDRLTGDLGMAGDYNIAYMFTAGMVASAWSTFILKAKSLDKRRPKEHRKTMAKIVEDMMDAYEEVIRQAVNYGKIYDKNMEVKNDKYRF